jgi:hypothetical protein
VHVGFSWILGKLYTNSVMASLNLRKQNRGYSEDNTTSGGNLSGTRRVCHSLPSSPSVVKRSFFLGRWTQRSSGRPQCCGACVNRTARAHRRTVRLGHRQACRTPSRERRQGYLSRLRTERPSFAARLLRRHSFRHLKSRLHIKASIRAHIRLSPRLYNPCICRNVGSRTL